MGKIIQSSLQGPPQVNEVKDAPGPSRAAIENVQLVHMVKFDALAGTKEDIDVHPTCVEAHQDKGWLVAKE